MDYLLSSNSSNEDKLAEIIDRWKNTESSPVTWATVIAAIENPFVNDEATADLIRQYLSTG